jgi:hypothetical protein
MTIEGWSTDFAFLPIAGDIHLLLSLFDKRMSNRNESDQQSQGQINVKEHVVRRIILTFYPCFDRRNIRSAI